MPTPRVMDDRRERPRVPLMVPGWIWRKAGGEPIAVRLLDESEEGVGFVSPVALEKGEPIELALGREGIRRRPVRVTFCEGVNADTFRVGAVA
jgi:hypothetical protein